MRTLPFLLLALAASAFGQEATIKATISAPNKTQNSVVAHLRLLDAQGMVPANVDASHLTIAAAGKPCEIQSISKQIARGEGMKIVLAMDVSGSIRPAFSKVQDAADRFVDRLTDKDKVSIIAFGDDVKVAQTETSDKRAVKAAIKRLSAHSQSTVLFDAIDRAVNVGARDHPEQRAVILITDGKDEGSSLKEDDIVTIVERSQVPVYTIGFGPEVQPKVLKRIALTSNGGSYYSAPSQADIAKVYDEAFSRVFDEYVLNFSVPLPDGETRPIDIVWKPRADQQAKWTGVLDCPGIPLPWWRNVLLWCGAGVLLLFFIVGGWLISARSRHEEPAAELLPALIGPARSTFEEAPAPQEESPTLGPGGFLTTPSDEESATVIRSAAKPAIALLFATEGPMQGRQFMIRSRDVVIGRSHDAEISFADDEQVSRRHAKITCEEDGSFLITDMASTNGIRLNDEAVTQHKLEDGDRLLIGDTVLAFKIIQAEEKDVPNR